MRRTTRIARLTQETRRRVLELRRERLSVLAICERLGIDKSSERNAVSQICAEPALRRYQVGIESPGQNSSPHRIRTGNWA